MTIKFVSDGEVSAAADALRPPKEKLCEPRGSNASSNICRKHRQHKFNSTAQY